MNERRDIGFKGYYLSGDLDLSNIREQHRLIELYKNGKLSKFIEPFLKAFNNLVNLDYVIKSDKLENVDYGDIEEDLKGIKYALITNSGVLAFQYGKSRKLVGEDGVYGFRNDTDFGDVFKEIIKSKNGRFKIISFDNLQNFYKKSKVNDGFRTCQLQDSFVKNTHLIFINPVSNEFKVLPNKNHMLAIEQIIEMAKRASESGEKLNKKALESINKLLFAGSERDGETGIGKFRQTNVLVGWPPMWDTIVIRQVVKRDDLGNPIEYNNEPLLKEIDELFDWYNSTNLSPVIKAAIMNLELARIQPFRDGNKRVSRLFTNYELIKNGYPTITFRAKSKLEYDERLARGINSKDITEFAQYLIDMIYLQQNAYLNEIETLKLYLEDDMKKENSINFEIASSDEERY